MFHDGTDAFGGFLTDVISKMAKMEKWAIIRQIRSGFVGVPCKKAPGLRRFMALVAFWRHFFGLPEGTEGFRRAAWCGVF
jgi:hypothetical protein